MGVFQISTQLQTALLMVVCCRGAASHCIQICSAYQFKIHVIHNGPWDPAFQIEEPALLALEGHGCVHPSNNTVVDLVFLMFLLEPGIALQILVNPQQESPQPQAFVKAHVPHHLTWWLSSPGFTKVCLGYPIHIQHQT